MGPLSRVVLGGGFGESEDDCTRLLQAGRNGDLLQPTYLHIKAHNEMKGITARGHRKDRSVTCGEIAKERGRAAIGKNKI